MTEPSSQADAGEHPHDLVPQPDQDAQPQRTGTGAVQLTEMGWSTEGPTQRETIAHHGDTLTIRARLVVHQPCDELNDSSRGCGSAKPRPLRRRPTKPPRDKKSLQRVFFFGNRHKVNKPWVGTQPVKVVHSIHRRTQ